MGLFGNENKELVKKISVLKEELDSTNAMMGDYHDIIRDIMFTGQKNEGELPNVPPYFVNFYELAKNAYNVYLKTPNVQNLINRTCSDAIGTGLQMNYEPDLEALSFLGISNIPDETISKINSLWRSWANSSLNDVKKEKSFNRIQYDVLHSSLIAGDSVVVPSFKNNNVRFQIIDSSFVEGSDSKKAIPTDHYVIEGVEFDKAGVPVAYNIYSDTLEDSKRVTRFKGALSLERIFLVKSPLLYRPNEARGISAIGSILEVARKTDRFVEAAASSWEETAKHPYWVEAYKQTQDELDEADRITANMRRGNNPATHRKINDGDAQMAAFEQTMRASYEKTVKRLPPGFTMKTFESSHLLESENFIDFLESSMGLVMLMPPEVRKQAFNSNYTASRAAILGWFYTLDEVYRFSISEQLNKKMFQYWLSAMVSSGVIKIDGFIDALLEDNGMAIEAFTKCNWVGRRAPQVDPLKEAKAIRELLGDEYSHVPLDTLNNLIVSKNNRVDTKTFIDSITKELTDIEKLPNTAKAEKEASLEVQKQNIKTNTEGNEGS